MVAVKREAFGGVEVVVGGVVVSCSIHTFGGVSVVERFAGVGYRPPCCQEWVLEDVEWIGVVVEWVRVGFCP